MGKLKHDVIHGEVQKEGKALEVLHKKGSVVDEKHPMHKEWAAKGFFEKEAKSEEKSAAPAKPAK